MPSTLDALSTICQIINAAHTAETSIPPTLVYNEGWLLRLVLSAAQRGIPCLPFKFAAGSRWYSEALLYSAFLPRHRGDALAESWTHADAVVGHFRFNPESKAGVMLDATCNQFVVLEAKIFSGLSQGTTRAKTFDQAARNVACMAESIRRSGRSVESIGEIGFHVLAPMEKIKLGVFSRQMTKAEVLRKIEERISSYDGSFRDGLREWNEKIVKSLVERMTLTCLDWESIIDSICKYDSDFGRTLRTFYDRTLEFNRQAQYRDQAASAS